MNLMWWFYLVNVVENFAWYFCLLTILCIIGGVICIFTAFALADDQNTTDVAWKTWRRYTISFTCVGFVSLFFSLAMPKEKTMYLMLGSKAAQEIVDNPAVKEVGGRLLKVVNKKLDELMPEEDKKEKK